MARARPLSARVISVLRAKAKNRKNITLGQLRKVYRRGQGAWLSSGSRPRIPMSAWAMARVNSALTGGKAAKVDRDILKGKRDKNRRPDGRKKKKKR